MRRIQYKLELFAPEYIISSNRVDCDGMPVPGEEYSSIKLSVLQCRNESWNNIDIADANINHDNWGNEENSVSKKFHNNYRSILHEENTDWILYSVEVSAKTLILNYLNPETNTTEWILFENLAGILEVQLSVPLQNGSISQYTIALNESFECNNGITENKATIIEEHGSTYRKLEFRHCSNNPAKEYAYVTECVDW